MDIDVSLEGHEGGENVMKSNKLFSEKQFVRSGWLYVKISTRRNLLVKSLWQPRFVEASVCPEQPGGPDSKLTIYRSEDKESSLLSSQLLGTLDTTRKRQLEESEAKIIPIKPTDKEPEFRWGHVIFTFEGVGVYGEFICESSEDRDAWVEWLQDYLLLRETNEMKLRSSPAHVMVKLADKIVKKYVADFHPTERTQHESASVQEIHPCSNLSVDHPPSKEVLWGATLRRIKAKRDHFTVYSTVMGLTFIDIDKIHLPFAEVEFAIENQWSTKLVVTRTGAHQDKHVLTAKDAGERDEWMQWLQYARVLPHVERVLQDGVEWETATLTINSRRRRRADEEAGATAECYVSLAHEPARLAFRVFPSFVKWETGEDDTGRTTYTDADEEGGKLAVVLRSGAAMVFEHAYDLYELYFRTQQRQGLLAATENDVTHVEKTGDSKGGQRWLVWPFLVNITGGGRIEDPPLVFTMSALFLGGFSNIKLLDKYFMVR